MHEIDQHTLLDELFGNGGFAYPLKEDGKPDYGFVTVGKRELKVINVTVINTGEKFIESLELEDGNILRGREVEIGG